MFLRRSLVCTIARTAEILVPEQRELRGPIVLLVVADS